MKRLVALFCAALWLVTGFPAHAAGLGPQGSVQAAVRSVTGTTWDYNGDWSALFDKSGIPSGDWNGRYYQWLQSEVGPETDIAGGEQDLISAPVVLPFSSPGGLYAANGALYGSFLAVPGASFTGGISGGLSTSTRGDGTIAYYAQNVPRITAPSSVTNLLTGSATLGTQSVTVGAGPLLLSFQGTGSVTLSGTATGTLAGMGATNRVSLPVVATAGSLTLTVSGSVTSAQLDPTEGVPLTTPRTYVPTTSIALTVDDWTAVRGNLLLRTDAIGTITPWVKFQVAATGGQPDAHGGTSASLIVPNVGTNTGGATVYQPGGSLGVVAGQTYTIQFEAKTNGGTFTNLATFSNAFVNYPTFTLTGAGSVAYSGGSGGSITALGNGWYLCSYTATAITSSPGNVLWYIGGVASVVGDGTSGIYIARPMIEPNLYTADVLAYPTTFIPNATSAPVYVYDQQLPGRGILIEQAATNLLQQSNVPTSATWTLLNASGFANATIAPDGSNTGSSIIDNATSARHINFQLDSVSVVGPYTYCAYAKAGTLGFAQVMLSTVDLKTYAATFNLSTGAETAIESVGSPTGTSYSSAAAAFGYFRLCVTENADATTGIYGITALSNSGTPTYDANGNPTYVGTGQNIYTYQADLIANAFPLSPIPTTSAAVTRAADVVGIPYSGFSVPHTGVVKYLRYAGQTSVVGRLVGLQSAAGVMSVYDDGATSDIFDKAGTGTIASTTGATLGLTRHVAWSVTPSLATISGGGGAPSSGAVSGLVAPTQGTLGSSAVGAQFLNGFIQSLTLYNTAKAAAKLQQLSQ